MNEYPINMIFDGIPDLLTRKGISVNTSDDGEWKVVSILYGGYIYNITTHHDEIINISRVKKEEINNE